MSNFPCLVRFTSGSGLVRYRLGEPLVDRYLEFVAGRCRPNTLRAEFGRREGEVLAQVPHGGGSWLSRAALALPVLSEAAGRLVDPAPRPVALQDPRHGNDPGTQDDRHEHQTCDGHERERDVPGRVQVPPSGTGPAPPVRGRRERADAGPEREHRQNPGTNRRPGTPVTVPKAALTINRPPTS